MTIQLFRTFVDHARDVAEHDKPQAIAAMQSALCCRDVPEDYKRDAREIMTLLLLDYFKA